MIRTITLDEAMPQFPVCHNTLLHKPSAVEMFLSNKTPRDFIEVMLDNRPLFMEWVAADDVLEKDGVGGFWCPCTDGDTLHYHNHLVALADKYPDVLTVDPAGFPYALVSNDPVAVAEYVKNSESRKTQTAGEKYQSVRHVVEPYSEARDAELTEIKRQRYPDFLSCRHFLTYFSEDVAEDWYFLSGYLPDGQWLHTCVMAAGADGTLHVPIFVGNADAPRTYYAYAIAHFACVRHGWERGLPVTSFGAMFDYKLKLGFPTVWLPSLRVRRDVLLAHGIRPDTELACNPVNASV